MYCQSNAYSKTIFTWHEPKHQWLHPHSFPHPHPSCDFLSIWTFIDCFVLDILKIRVTTIIDSIITAINKIVFSILLIYWWLNFQILYFHQNKK
jgi:hypothetical protein